MSNFVHVKEAILITPSEQTPNHVLHLSALDSQTFVRFTFEYLLVYKPNNGIQRSTIIENVKKALGRALVPYYPLAGRVRNRADGLGLEVVCRAQGSSFIEAVSDSSVSEFESAPKRRKQWRKFLSLHVADVLKGAPPLVVQLTWLLDGGATLAVGFNHCLCDGVGSGEFLNSFAELAIGKRGLHDLNPKPIWSRHLLDPTRFESTHDDNPLMSGHPEFEIVPDISKFISRFSQERLTPTSITFNKVRLNELKKQLAKYNQLLAATSFEVLSAHVWRCWAKALNLPSNQIVKLVFSMNIRERMKPSLPGGYYGNAFVLGCSQALVSELMGTGLDYATMLVRNAKERVGDEYVREVVESVMSSTHHHTSVVDSVGVLIMTQWSRIGLQTVDFGMGCPVQVGPVCCDKYCLLLPDCDRTDAVKVNLAIPTSVVDQYLHFLNS